MSSEPDATRVALVTGGSGGIGRDAAIRLATACFRVVVNYAGHVAEADAVIVMLPIPAISSVTHLGENLRAPLVRRTDAQFAAPSGAAMTRKETR